MDWAHKGNGLSAVQGDNESHMMRSENCRPGEIVSAVGQGMEKAAAAQIINSISLENSGTSNVNPDIPCTRRLISHIPMLKVI